MSELKFNEVVYTKEILESMTDENLLVLRNAVATELGVATIASMKNHDAAVAQTLKALERFSAQAAPAPAKAKADKAAKPKVAKPKKEKGEYVIPKSAHAKTIKRPNKKMFGVIKIIGEHDGTSKMGRPERWANYKDGMMLIDVEETHGTESWDVGFWTSIGLMEVIPATDEEYAQRRAAWFKAKGTEDPETVKATKAAAAAARKAAKEAEQSKAA